MKVSRRAIPLSRLLELWQKYSEFRKGQLAPSTYRQDYPKIERRILKMQREAPQLRNAIAVRDWLIQHYSAETARRTLQQFNACCQWAQESEMLNHNPFLGVQKHIQKARPQDTNWVAFTVAERDRIIQEFELREPRYAPWVKFLFYVGCRPSEAAALQWRNVAVDCREILISESFRADMPEAQKTKNQRSTRFPCNARLQRLLLAQRPAPWGRDQFVFPGDKGGRFHYTNFQRRYWEPMVRELAERGLIALYLSQYHARHTWITEALNHLSVAEVSYLARVSTGVLMKHYVGRNRIITIPEF